MRFKSIIKDPGESLDYKFDFGSPDCQDPYLEPGETISLATVSVPVGLVKESTATADAGRSVLVWLSGGTAGVTYAVVCSITTNTSRTVVRTMPILVQNR